MYADVIHSKMLRTSLQSLVQSKSGYTRDLSGQEENPEFRQPAISLPHGKGMQQFVI